MEGGDKARAEFLSEAQELVETLSRNLLSLEQGRSGGGRVDPEHLNEAFRSVHTLKSLSGLFGDKHMSQLSHRLEDVLDDLRLGRQQLSDAVLDLLFTSVDVYWQILTTNDAQEVRGVQEILERLEKLAPTATTESADLENFEIDQSLLAVLTEYEEHRLLVSVKQGLELFLVRVQFELATLDKALTEIKDRAKPFGEVITYLPAGEAASPDLIELDLLLASATELATIQGALANERISVRQIPRIKKAPARSVKASARTGMPRGNAPGTRPVPAPIKEPAAAAGPLSEAAPEEAAVAEAPAAGAGLLRSVSQTVRVDIHKLDELMNVVGKLAVLRGGLSELTENARSEGHRRLGSQLGQLAHKFERSLRELQSGILEVRMVPLAQVFERLTRIVRKTGRDLNKDVRLVVTGAETEIDKLIVEELSDPLMHIIRNAIDHGIEDAEERQRIGKPAVGTIALNAFQKGNHVVIEAEDDGRGLNSDSLLDRAIALGAIAEHEAKELSRADALNLVFLPGLSTREKASAVSGRGVGMDVVKTNIAKLGGSIELESEPVIGTKITLTLPLTRAIVTALLVQVGNGMFAIPLTSISEVNALERSQIRMIDTTEVLSRRGSSLELCRLRQLFGLDGDPGPSREFVVEVMAGTRHLGLVVDALSGQQDIIIRPLGRSLHAVRGFSGASELADERIALVLDPGALIEEASLSGSRERTGRYLQNG
jgi:two-component system, chemotaxis family, sensor kinase CheA